MKKLFFFLLIGSSLLSVSCSSDDNESPKASAIVLTLSAPSIDLGNSVTLSATDNLKQDISSTAVFTANGITLESKVFTPKAAGTYKITAKKDGITSNEVVLTVNAVATSIVLSSTAAIVDLGSPVTLKVVNNLSQDVTSSSTFTANSTSISGAAFTATAAGTYKIVAKNGTLTSNEITVTVKEVALQNSIFTGGKNYAVSNSAIEYIAKAIQTGSTVPTHTVFRLVAYNSTSDYSAIKSTLTSNTISLTFLVPLGPTGEVLAPTASNIILPKIEVLVTDSKGTAFTSREEATLTFNTAVLPSTANAPFSFKATAKFNMGSNVELNFNGNLNGLY